MSMSGEFGNPLRKFKLVFLGEQSGEFLLPVLCDAVSLRRFLTAFSGTFQQKEEQQAGGKERGKEPKGVEREKGEEETAEKGRRLAREGAWGRGIDFRGSAGRGRMGAGTSLFDYAHARSASLSPSG